MARKEAPDKIINARNLVLVVLSVLILIVLLHSFGAFDNPNPGYGGNIGTVCAANSGYSCKNPTFNRSNGYSTVLVSQNTGTNWTSANFVFVPQGTTRNSMGIPLISFTSYPANTSYSAVSLLSGKIIQVSLPVNGIVTPVAVGTAMVGDIWAQYTIASSASPQYVEIASLAIKAS